MEKSKLIIDFFLKAMDQIPVVVLVDSKGRYLYVNDNWSRTLGIDSHNIYGKYVHDIVPETRVDEVIKSGKPIYGYEVFCHDGNRLFNNCIPLFEGDKVCGAIIITSFLSLEEANSFTDTIAKITAQVSYYKEELRKIRGAKHCIDEIIGSSPQIQALKEKIRFASRTNSAVLIEGETGSGKELIANAIHDLSKRRENPFIKINCSAIPQELFESELFGYDGGAFTGANKKGKIGLFEAANSGSLFLDEINSISLFSQPKLLRVLQEKEIRHIGSNYSIPIDVRVIAATNTPLESLINDGKFRNDLYYRINVVTVSIPPLRQRITDIPELIEHFRIKLNRSLGTRVDGFSSDVAERLMEYHWPGNVRELNNVVERAMNNQTSGVITWDAFSDYFQMRLPRSEKFQISSASLLETKACAEKEAILSSLERNHYNKSKVSKELGISRTMLYKKLHLYGIEL